MKRQYNAVIKTLSDEDAEAVKYCAGEIEVFVESDFNKSRADREETERITKAVMDALPEGWGGYRTGYGSYILSKGYAPLGDWNDKSSRVHY